LRELGELIEEEREGLEALHMYGAVRREAHMMQRYLDSGDLVEAYKCGYVIAMYIAKRVRVSRPKSRFHALLKSGRAKLHCSSRAAEIRLDPASATAVQA
jgi:hypothetical protein